MQQLKERDDFCIIIGVKERHLANKVIKSLHPLQTHILIGNDYPSFSKLVNEAIVRCPTEIFIFCSHRVAPTPNDISILLQRIDEGYGLATLYRLGCFGFRKELIRRIGFFDERFLIGGWEDDDFYIRLHEANISYYEDESIPYLAGKSLWQHPPNKPLMSQIHYNNKWERNDDLKIITRKLSEITTYDIGPKNMSMTFKPWSESRLLHVTGWQKNYTIQSLELIENKRILIFGGTGSLGHKLVDILDVNNEITIFSRDENKHWHMGQNHDKLSFVIGDIRDSNRVRDVILDVSPHIIVIAAALKHVDKCEYEVNEALNTNLFGTINVLDTVKLYHTSLNELNSVVFISTDKACSPINTYGLTKGLAEKAVIETAYKMRNKSKIQFVSVRYGNVLNSRGSIIEVLNKIGNSALPNYKLNHKDMTRFIMTQTEAVNLIIFAIKNGKSGDIIVPKLMSMRIKDLVELFAKKYNKEISISSLRPGEKMHEALLNDTEIPRIINNKNYFVIKPPYNCKYTSVTNLTYNSSVTLLTKKQLEFFLQAIGMY
jgi:nucleoside-diphosphate-sugar epimerase